MYRSEYILKERGAGRADFRCAVGALTAKTVTFQQYRYYMDIRIQTAADTWQADCAIALFFENTSFEDAMPALWTRCSWLAASPARRDVTGKKGERMLLHGPAEQPVSRILAVGLGKRDAFSADGLRRAIAEAITACRKYRFSATAVAVEGLHAAARALDIPVEHAAQEAVYAAMAALYRLEAYKNTDTGEADPEPASLSFLFADASEPAALAETIQRGEAEAKGVLFARNLANGPANYITPIVVGEQATGLAARYGFSCMVLGPEVLREIGMGAFAAVAQGSDQPARFIILEHCPAGKEADDPIIFVGKGITFDSGGISLKPAADMHKMKSDLGGAAAVLGFFEALGRMPDAQSLPRVIGLVAATENMPSGKATRPGDVVTSLSGKTVEILNTDAEGRLLLCDALTYAQQEWKPKVVIDIATLTGACVVALGAQGTGLFTDDKELRRMILNVAETTGDLCWPLPLWQSYDEKLKSAVADVPNMGKREGGALFAALFLRRFIEQGTRWAHLDIAGPGITDETSPLQPVPGGTGVGVRLFSRLHRILAEQRKAF